MILTTLLLVPLLVQAETPPPMSKKDLTQFTQDALLQAFNDLGLGPSEKKVFDAEAIGDAQAFVINYRSSGETTDVQIDRNKLKNYLRFSRELFSSPRVCVTVSVAKGCAACEVLKKPVAEALSARLEKRGFTAAAGPGLPEESELSGESAFDSVAARSIEAGCTGLVYGELKVEHTPDEDEEGEELDVRWNSYFALRDSGGKKIKGHGTNMVQVPANLTNESAARQFAAAMLSRSLPESYSQLASQVTRGPQLAAGADEHYLRLEGVASFGTYARFKQTAMNELPELKLEERVLSPGVIEFAVANEVDLVQAATKLKGLQWGGQALDVLRSSPEEVAVRFR